MWFSAAGPIGFSGQLILPRLSEPQNEFKLNKPQSAGQDRQLGGGGGRRNEK